MGFCAILTCVLAAAETWKRGTIHLRDAGSMLTDSAHEPQLSASGINATGASLVLKMAGVQSWATEVVSHVVGQDAVEYARLPDFESALVDGRASGHYFLENKLAFLDQVRLPPHSARSLAAPAARHRR